MVGMSRRGPATVAALLSSFALVATLPVPCACLPEPVVASEHGCCSTPAGLRPADLGCCTAAAEPAPDTPATAPATTPAVAPVLVVVVSAMPAAVPAHERATSSSEPLVSPPLTVRRV